jgi:tetratricopeptide (TPR) repeat protein
MMVITSRHELTALVAINGAHVIHLPLLDSEESRRLIAQHLGVRRVREDEESVDELIRLCAGLPLALSIASARAATRPDFPLSAMVTQLRDAHGRLDVLSLGQPSADIRAVFACSYTCLDEPAARMFRLLGIHPGPEISTTAAASLAGIPLHEAVQQLEQLSRAQLLTERQPQRYFIHDLLRVYASELAHTNDSEEARQDAVTRVLDHYLHTAHAGALLLQPFRSPLGLTAPHDTFANENLRSDIEAMKWFAAEHGTLLNSVRLAAASGDALRSWQIAWTMVMWCARRGLWTDLETAQRAALGAAQQADDRLGQAYAHRYLGSASGLTGEDDAALTHLEQALLLFQQLGDNIGRAEVHQAISHELERRKEFREAFEHAHIAFELFRAAGRQAGEADGLNNMGWLCAHLGEHERALGLCHQALALSQELGHRECEARTWDSLGYAYHHLGRLNDAADCYGHAILLYQSFHEQYQEAGTRDRLGDTHAAANDIDAAHAAWREAAAALERLNHPAARQIQNKLICHTAS